MACVRPLPLIVLVLLSAVPARAGLPHQIPHQIDDDCDARFIAFIGSDAYRFSPRHRGDLGAVRLFTLLSHQRAARHRDFGQAFWQLTIRSGNKEAALVRSVQGVVRIEDASGVAKADFLWDGRDQQGAWVPPGRYRYTFEARFLPDRVADAESVRSYPELGNRADADEAYASTDEVIVDYALPVGSALRLRESLAATTCEVQQNAPLEAGFAYNFYYGSTHSHSSYSDGGHPPGSCSSGAGYGTGTFTPADVFAHARQQAGLDYWVVNEHNHLINDAVANSNPPVTEAKVRQRYASGRAQADAATVSGSFVGVYGMEWGVTTNSDQGHVTLMETPKLFGWETCSNCNGSAAECTPGTNCYFDVFTPKRFGYLTLYRRSVENPSPAGALGILCHPGSGEFDNYAFDANADQALQGIAVRSGLAFNTSAQCGDANVGSSDYSGRWRDALNRGFHLGPVADHDTHCNVFGQGIPNRTVYLLPNGSAPALTKAALLQAHKARHFFASEDANAQLVFRASNGRIMGDIFSASSGLSLRAAVYDPSGEAVSTLEVWRGQAGGGVPGAPYRTASNQSTLSFTESLASGTYYYYVHAVQADGHDLWSAPMWITWSGGSLDVSGWRVAQANSAQSLVLPAGTRIPADGYLIVARNASRAAFESFWSRTLGPSVAFVNAAGAFPVINGDETFTLFDGSGATVDGPTVSMPAGGGRAFQRRDPCQAANLSASWNNVAAASAGPGSGAGPGCGRGVVINEFADPSGTGQFVYEFVELHWDR